MRPLRLAAVLALALPMLAAPAAAQEWAERRALGVILATPGELVAIPPPPSSVAKRWVVHEYAANDSFPMLGVRVNRLTYPDGVAPDLGHSAAGLMGTMASRPERQDYHESLRDTVIDGVPAKRISFRWWSLMPTGRRSPTLAEHVIVARGQELWSVWATCVPTPTSGPAPEDAGCRAFIDRVVASVRPDHAWTPAP